MRRILILAFACALTVGIIAPASAGRASHFWTKNDTADVWVWMTVYSTSADPSGSSMRENEGAWCIAPGAFDKHGLSVPIGEILFEFKHGSCRAGNFQTYRRGISIPDRRERYDITITTGGGRVHTAM